MATTGELYREYETILVLKPDLEDERLVELTDRIREQLKEGGGKSIKFQNWGKKKLTFEKDKQQKGIFIHHQYVAKPAFIPEYERALKFMDDALLYQTVRLQDKVDIEQRSEEADVLAAPNRESRREREERAANAAAKERQTRAAEDSARTVASPGESPATETSGAKVAVPSSEASSSSEAASSTHEATSDEPTSADTKAEE